MTSNPTDLPGYGWSQFFAGQLDLTDLDTLSPVRVSAVHRDKLAVVAPGRDDTIPAPISAHDDERITVGDWLLLDADSRVVRRLDRKSVFKRRAAGEEARTQAIAANVDTVFIVSSCNADYNIARIERYLVLAADAGVDPVIVLTKADLAKDPEAWTSRARTDLRGYLVETVSALDPASLAPLTPWLGRGQTVALMGSSGVGKTTLANALGAEAAATATIREDDAKGRHTTTARHLRLLPSGAWLLDTPGMRELGLADVAAGLSEVFDDIETLAARCRFSDCAHDGEPGCAVARAVAAGDLDEARLERWRKLSAEDARNTESLAQRRRRDKAFGKMVRQVVREKDARKR